VSPVRQRLYLTGLRSNRTGGARAASRTWILGAQGNACSEARRCYGPPAPEGCQHCGVTATRVTTEFGPHWLGHNAQRVCKRCGKRWCTERPRESWGLLWSFCSPACKRAWDRGAGRVCAVCGVPMPGRRADAKTCSGACRVALHRSRQRS
jgi:hypothetical protein